MIQGFAAGYFLWDFCVSAMHVDVFGWGMLAHAVSALIVFSLGFVSDSSFVNMLLTLTELVPLLFSIITSHSILAKAVFEIALLKVSSW